MLRGNGVAPICKLQSSQHLLTPHSVLPVSPCPRAATRQGHWAHTGGHPREYEEDEKALPSRAGPGCSLEGIKEMRTRDGEQ